MYKMSQDSLPVDRVLFCPVCSDERPFVQPECADGHGADCPEWACAECGHAVLVSPLTQLRELAPASAPAGRGAAVTHLAPSAVPVQPVEPAARLAVAGHAAQSRA